MRTDHYSLKWMMTLTDKQGSLMSWHLRLMEFDCDIVYRPSPSLPRDFEVRLSIGEALHAEVDVDIHFFADISVEVSTQALLVT